GGPSPGGTAGPLQGIRRIFPPRKGCRARRRRAVDARASGTADLFASGRIGAYAAPVPDPIPPSSNGPPSLHLLVLEDDPVYRHLLAASLTSQARAAGTEVVIHAVATLAQALDRLATGGIDAVIADLNLPDSTGAQTYEALVEASDLPVVV